MLSSPLSCLGTVTAGQRTAAQDPADAISAPFQGVLVICVASLSWVHAVDATAADSLDTVGSRRGTGTGPTLGRVEMIYVLISGALVWGSRTLVWQQYDQCNSRVPLAVPVAIIY